eukprot:3215213-Amphidinium_carterae.3
MMSRSALNDEQGTTSNHSSGRCCRMVSDAPSNTREAWPSTLDRHFKQHLLAELPQTAHTSWNPGSTQILDLWTWPDLGRCHYDKPAGALRARPLSKVHLF